MYINTLILILEKRDKSGAIKSVAARYLYPNIRRIRILNTNYWFSKSISKYFK